MIYVPNCTDLIYRVGQQTNSHGIHGLIYRVGQQTSSTVIHGFDLPGRTTNQLSRYTRD